MTERFKVGDRVGWNSEAPQYEIKSSTTDHIAAHKRSALTKLSD